jgi:hypothetical protein
LRDGERVRQRERQTERERGGRQRERRERGEREGRGTEGGEELQLADCTLRGAFDQRHHAHARVHVVAGVESVQNVLEDHTIS